MVSTDSEDYRKMALSYGADASFLRPKSISNDTSNDIGFVLHALKWFEDYGQNLPEMIIHLRPTTLFRDPETIDDAITTFQSSDNITSMRSVHVMPESAYKCFKLNDDGYLKTLGYNTMTLDDSTNARHYFPQTYCANGYVDIL